MTLGRAVAPQFGRQNVTTRTYEAQLTSRQSEVEELYREHRNSMAAYLICLELPAAQVQEVVQEVFLRLYKALCDGQDIENRRAWLFRVSHNLGLNVRARERYRHSTEPDWDRVPSPKADSPETALLAKERALQMSAALRTLSPQQRNCLFLRAEGLRYREIAEVLGIKPSTVGEFLARATQRIAEALNA